MGLRVGYELRLKDVTVTLRYVFVNLFIESKSIESISTIDNANQRNTFSKK